MVGSSALLMAYFGARIGSIDVDGTGRTGEKRTRKL
jgi:hypothetical protein